MIYIRAYNSLTDRPPMIIPPKNGYKYKIDAKSIGEAINILHQNDIPLTGLDLSQRPYSLEQAPQSWENLNTLEFSGKIFENCNFNRQIVSGNFLKGTKFIKCSLKEVNLEDKFLSGVLFKSCELEKIKLSKAQCLNVSFEGSNINSADFTNASICEPIFKNIKATNVKWDSIKWSTASDLKGNGISLILSSPVHQNTIVNRDITEGASIIGGTWKDTNIPQWMPALLKEKHFRENVNIAKTIGQTVIKHPVATLGVLGLGVLGGHGLTGEVQHIVDYMKSLQELSENTVLTGSMVAQYFSNPFAQTGVFLGSVAVMGKTLNHVEILKEKLKEYGIKRKEWINTLDGKWTAKVGEVISEKAIKRINYMLMVNSNPIAKQVTKILHQQDIAKNRETSWLQEKMGSGWLILCNDKDASLALEKLAQQTIRERTVKQDITIINQDAKSNSPKSITWRPDGTAVALFFKGGLAVKAVHYDNHGRAELETDLKTKKTVPSNGSLQDTCQAMMDAIREKQTPHLVQEFLFHLPEYNKDTHKVSFSENILKITNKNGEIIDNPNDFGCIILNRDKKTATYYSYQEGEKTKSCTVDITAPKPDFQLTSQVYPKVI